LANGAGHEGEEDESVARHGEHGKIGDFEWNEGPKLVILPLLEKMRLEAATVFIGCTYDFSLESEKSYDGNGW
jgi:hypothetical protein